MVKYRMLDHSLTARFGEDASHVYWHLGMIQSIDIYYAKKLGGDYHLLVPDTIYSQHHFSALLDAVERGHTMVTRLGLSTYMEGICPAVDAYRQDGVIRIPAADLMALGVSHIHSASVSWIATGRDTAEELPSAPMIGWEGKDHLYMMSPHQTVLYIDASFVAKVEKRYYVSLDSELDKVIPGGCEIYHPKAEDGICLLEITPRDKRPTPLSLTPIKEYARIFWHCAQHSKAFWPLYTDPIIDPLNRTLAPDRPYMSEEEIAHTMAQLKETLLQYYPQISEQEAKRALHMLEMAAKHPNAQTMQPRIAEEKAQIEQALSSEG